MTETPTKFIKARSATKARTAARASSSTMTPIKFSAARRITLFSRLVYAYTKRIPKGRVSTYKLIAAAIGRPRAYRAVGTSLSLNPFAPHVPCHRVVTSGGSMGGFKGKKAAPGCLDVSQKIAMLQAEGVVVVNGKLVNASSIMALGGAVTNEEIEDSVLANPL